MPKLSVIIPIYNVEKYLRKCLDSVIEPAVDIIKFGQLPDYEIIAVNDGSTDSSAEIAAEYEARFPGFFRLISTENQGQGHARNVGIELSQADYLYFIDSDDYLVDGGMNNIMSTLNKDFDILIFDSVTVNTDYEELEYRRGCGREGEINLDSYPELLLDGPDVWNKIFRRRLFTDSGIRFTCRVWFEDLRTVPKLYALTDKIVYIPQAWHRYLQRPGSVTNMKCIERNLEIIPAVDELLEFYYSGKYAQSHRDVLEYLAFRSEFLTSSVRANLADYRTPVQDELISDFLVKHPDYAQNPYFKTMGRNHRLLTSLLLRRNYLTVHLLMKANNLVKNKKL